VQRGSKVTFDAELTGFAVRATVKAKAFVLNAPSTGYSGSCKSAPFLNGR
jgi:hypothetical protein